MSNLIPTFIGPFSSDTAAETRVTNVGWVPGNSGAAARTFTLVDGLTYYNTTDKEQKVYNGSSWASVVYNAATTRQQAEDQGIDVKTYGAKGDGTTDDTAAIQAAIADVETYSRPSSGATYYGNSTRVNLPIGVYVISSPVVLDSAYVSLGSLGATLKPSATFDQNEFAVQTGAMWQGEIHNLTFSGFDKCMKIANANLDQGKIALSNLSMHGADIGIELDARSTLTSIVDCKFDKVIRALDVITGDKVVVENCWIKQGVLEAGEATIINRDGDVTLQNVVGVPNTAAGSKTAWVNNYRRLIATGTRFGGETGSMPAVNNYAQADTAYPINPNYVHLTNCDVYSITDAVRLFYLPNEVSIRNCQGFVDTDYTIAFDDEEATLADELTRVGKNFSIVLDNSRTGNPMAVSDRELLDFVSYASRYVYQGQIRTSTASPEVLPIPPRNTSEYSLYKIKAYGGRGTNVDTYTEAIAKGGDGSNFAVFTLRQGPDTVSPLFSVSGDDILVGLNGDAGTRTVFYVVEKIGRWLPDNF